MNARVELLGGARVVSADGGAVALRPTMRDQALAYLAYEGGWVTRDRLGFLFWPDVPDEKARHNVRQLLKRMRRLDWLTDLETDGDRLRWRVTTDVGDLRRAIVEERWGDLPSSAVLLPGFERHASAEYERWLLAERDEVNARWRAGLVAAATDAKASGDPGRGARLLEPLLNEIDGHHLLAEYLDLQVLAGNPAVALAAFDRVTARMRRELGVDAPAGVRQLAERIRAGLATRDRGPTPTYVGRTREVAEVVGLLARPACRLVTLLGPGGIGKSTLAWLVVDAIGDRYQEGARTVPLAATSGPEQLPATVASALSITLDGRADPADQLARAIGTQHLLLVLDNVEHLLAAGPTVSQLVHRCPRLQVLVTSRERLRLEPEWVYDVPGLHDDDAVDLFVRRAQQVAPTAEVPRNDALTLCGAVGGAPLGIELAATWLRVMPCREIVAAIEEDLGILGSGRRDAPARHRSLQASMRRSWELADSTERDAVEALSVFTSPYTQELATAVAAAPPTVLRSLIDKSLVQRGPDGRYASHPLVRQYAASRLTADGRRWRTVRHRHADALLTRLEDPARARELLPSVEDAVLAWRHAVEHGDADLLASSAEGFVELVAAAGRFTLGLTLLDAAARRLQEHEPAPTWAHAALRLGQARLLNQLGRHDAAGVAAEAALDLATRAGSDRLVVRTLLALGWARKWSGGDRAQYATVLEARPVAERLEDRILAATVLNDLGCSAPTLGQCREHLREGLELVPGSETSTQVRLLANLGIVSWALDDTATALRCLDEAAHRATDATSSHELAFVLAQQAFVHAQAGELPTAQRLVERAGEAVSAVELHDVSTYVHLVAGEISRLLGDASGARRHARAALEAADAVHNVAFAVRALRLHGQLLVDVGATDRGLRELAFVLAHTDRRGDFTCEVLNPRAWEEATAGVATARAERARRAAEEVELGDLVAAALDDRAGAVAP